jgi:hypothetical protein
VTTAKLRTDDETTAFTMAGSEMASLINATDWAATSLGHAPGGRKA